MSTGNVKKYSFSERLFLLMREKGLRKIDVAKSIGVSHPIVNNWLQGRVVPGGENLVALARFFHCSVDYLLGLSEIKVTISDGSGEQNQVLPDGRFQVFPDGGLKGESLDGETVGPEQFVFPSNIERSCLDYFNQFLKSCDRDPIKLGWIMTELKTHFPLNKWERDIKREQEIKWNPNAGDQIDGSMDP